MFDRCLYFNLNALTRRVNKIWESAFKELGLSPAHAYLLRLVIAQPGISQQSIGGELMLEKSTVTRFIEALSDKGYLTKTKVGREQLIYPSDKSKAIAVQLEDQGQELYELLKKTMGHSELSELVNDIKQTKAKLD
jgi:DNA-binding MarR family transcriptional regulator